jgi:hypothetical protein
MEDAELLELRQGFYEMQERLMQYERNRSTEDYLDAYWETD